MDRAEGFLVMGILALAIALFFIGYLIGRSSMI